MPTYQYQCTTCDEGLEAVQKFTDEALTTCPSCSGRLRKIFSAVGVVFKGSGFYRTDSRDSSSPSAAAKSSGSGSDTGSGSDSGGSGSQSKGSSSDSSSSSNSSNNSGSGSSGTSSSAPAQTPAA